MTLNSIGRKSAAPYSSQCPVWLSPFAARPCGACTLTLSSLLRSDVSWVRAWSSQTPTEDGGAAPHPTRRAPAGSMESLTNYSGVPDGIREAVKAALVVTLSGV